MKIIAKATLGALMLAGTAFAVTAPASAGFSIGIGVGPGYYGPGYDGPGYYGRSMCDPRSRYYNPYYCDDYDYYYGPPLFIDGYWYDRPVRSRWYGGHREFWVRDGWRNSNSYHGGGRFERGHGDWGGGGHGDWGRGGGRGGDWGHGGGHGGHH
jgi:hypothetical protein